MELPKTIKDPREHRLFDALEHEQFVWRTLGALSRESGLRPEEVRQVLAKHKDLVMEGVSDTGDPIWAFRERFWNTPSFVRFWSFLTNNTTSTSSGG